jgi:tetratricopeptide (TPR) repeat protein
MFLKSGKSYFRKQDYASALLQFKNAARLAPKDPEPWFYLGQAYLGVRDARQAIISLVRATQINPKYADAQIKLAELMVWSHRQDLLQSAQERMQMVLSDNPGNSDALVILASAQAHTGDLKDVEKYLKEALDKHPELLSASTALALMKLSQKDWGTAEGILKEAAIHAPNSPDPLVALGELYLFNGRPAEAEAQFRRALQIDSDHAPALLHLASQHAAAGRMNEAEAIYRKLSSQNRRQFGEIYPAFLLQQGKFDVAISEYKKTISSNPESRIAREGLVVAYVRAGRLQDAHEAVDQVLHGNPRDGGALLQKAQLLIRAGQNGEARQVLESLLASQPSFAEAHLLLSEVARIQNASVAQRHELAEALRLNPNLLQARLALAAAMIRDQGAKDALDLLRQAPAAQQRTPAYLAQRNWALLAFGDMAGFSAGIAAGLPTGATEFLVQDGVRRLMTRDFAGAQDSLEKALQRNPKDLRALEALANCYVQQKRPDVALQKVRAYAARAPQAPELHLFEGNWLANSGRLDEARSAFLAAQAASPQYAPASLALGRLEVIQRRYDEARRHLTQVLSINDRDLEAYRLSATMEATTGNYETAIRHYRKVLELAPADAAALNDLACLLSDHSSQLDEALTYAQRAKELAPDDPAADDTLGWIFCRKGIYQRALTHLQSASAKSDSAIPKYHLAIAYFRLGDMSRGRRALATAQSVDPNAAEAVLAKQAMTAAGVNR